MPGGKVIDWTLNIPTIVAIVGALGWLFRMEARTRENAKAIDELKKDIKDKNNSQGLVRGELSLIKDALHAQELYAARTFATKDGVTEALKRMETTLEGLASRFDTFAVSRAIPRSHNPP